MATAKSTPRATRQPSTAKSSSSRAREKIASAAAPAVAAEGSIDPKLAFAKPNWTGQDKIETRPLWEVAALAMNIDPISKGITSRRKADPQWQENYRRLVTAMCDALSPKRGNGIYYESDKPANITRIRLKRDLRFVRVDATSAVRFVVSTRENEQLPPQFLKLYEVLSQREGTSMNADSERSTPLAPPPPKKSQEKANETKESNLLATLLYVVVEREMGGWVDANDFQKEQIVQKISKYLDQHNIRSTRGLRPDGIEAAIVKGMTLAPLRRPDPK